MILIDWKRKSVEIDKTYRCVKSNGCYRFCMILSISNEERSLFVFGIIFWLIKEISFTICNAKD